MTAEPDTTEPEAIEPDTSEPEAPVDVWAVGGPVLVADAVGTAALVVVSILAAAWPTKAAELATILVAGLLFLGGCSAFAVGFVRIAGRSRFEVVDMAGTFYLTGSAPRPVRRWFLRLWFAQIAVVIATAAFIHPPFGFMALVFGIGMIPLWASRHATFPARDLRAGR
jgi:hypothetical protein